MPYSQVIAASSLLLQEFGSDRGERGERTTSCGRTDERAKLVLLLPCVFRLEKGSFLPEVMFRLMRVVFALQR